MDGIELRQSLRNGQRLYGCLTSTSPKWMDAVAGLDLDCVFVDAEHSPLGSHHLGWFHPRSAGYRRAREKQIPISHVPRPDG